MDIIAGLFELFGLWIIGNKSRIGFMFNLIGCCFWIYVAIDKHIYGLLIVVLPALFINGRNYMRWKHDKEAKDMWI